MDASNGCWSRRSSPTQLLRRLPWRCLDPGFAMHMTNMAHPPLHPIHPPFHHRHRHKCRPSPPCMEEGTKRKRGEQEKNSVGIYHIVAFPVKNRSTTDRLPSHSSLFALMSIHLEHSSKTISWLAEHFTH